ncbi:subtilase family protein [Striga asiatica]|uniref:Subtilase family protein n=1 Tax=Striga asiatica TaxID=4170 RepID=A0A5A7QUY0_STRAF|nr:subtilase family protein [Striga asiatica]
MENFYLSIALFFLLPFLVLPFEDKKVHIVLLGDDGINKTSQEIEKYHHSYLLSVKENAEDASSSLLYSYKKINGFAAVLTSPEALKLSEMEDVKSVFRSNVSRYKLHTTRSWGFSGLNEPTGGGSDKGNLWLESNYGSDVVIAVIDTGVWPESQSFNDNGMGPIPKSWKGKCQRGHAFNCSNCNRKIVGARYYLKGFEKEIGRLNTTLNIRSARDTIGHGSHTSSTALGRKVDNVSAPGGFAAGAATGGAPLARLAVYKVVWNIDEDIQGISDADILAAFDDAIADGANVVSISIGFEKATPYDEDVIAIGSLNAAKANVVVSFCAGNSGPEPATVLNVSPWAITVGASTIDRIYSSPVVLANKAIIPGQSVTLLKLKNKLYPLVSADQVSKSGVPKNESGQCGEGSLSPEKTKGKIVFCSGGGQDEEWIKGIRVAIAGGIGAIFGNSKADGDQFINNVYTHVLPATSVSYSSALKIMEYIKSTKNAKAKIVPATTILGAKPAPIVAPFSSSGPSAISPHILKPDIVAPGLNILAAWTEASPPSEYDLPGNNGNLVKYYLNSGTSMSAPHVAGALALLKAVHPTWSSAALRSALMTTAGQRNNEGNPITDYNDSLSTPLRSGSGHFDPTKAADPGLVYDASYKDYLLYLCSTGYTNLTHSFKCPANPPPPNNLNYPSLAVPDLKGTVTVVRTVTNVGGCGAVYFASIQPPPGVDVNISPSVLRFTQVNEKKKFTITVKANDNAEKRKYVFGSYKLSDGKHNVFSPIAVFVA